MKTFQANMTTHVAQRVHTLANMWRLTRQDGVVFGFTDHDQNLPYDDGDGEIVYEANSGMIASALSSSNQLRVDTQDTQGVLTSDRITDIDLRAGRYDNATIRYFKVNYEDLSASMGDIKMKVSRTGEVRTENDQFTVELRSLAQSYSQQIIDLIQPACGVDLGSAKCGVRIDPPEWAETTDYTVRTDRDAASGSVVKPSTHNDRYFKCITAGGSASAEPSWNLTLGGETVDNSVVWETVRALQIPSLEIIEVIDKGEFWVNYLGDAPNDLFTLGIIEFTSGKNVGLFREIKDFDMASDGGPLVQ